MEPTTIGYSNGAAGMSAAKDDGVYAELRYNHFFDMNGDGRDDLIYPSGGFWLVRLGQLNGTLSLPINTGMSADNARFALPMDYNGDGLGDLIYPSGTESAPGNWIVLRSQGTTFERILTNVPLLGSIYSQTTVDFNGDGLDDIMGIKGDGLYRIYNTPNGLVAGEHISNEGSSAIDAFLNHQIVPRSIYRRADFNGDGNDDLLMKQTITICIPNQGCSAIVDYQIYLLTATGSYAAANFYHENFIINGITILDVNGDGLSDIAYTQQATSNLNSNRLFLKISKGDGTLTTIDALPYDESKSIICAVPLDWDGDGRDDIVDAADGKGFYRVFRSNGEGFDPPFTTNVPSVSSCRVSVLDVNGDGRVDIASQHNNRFYIHTHHAGEPDLATRFRDGYGNEHTITYKPLTDPAVYTKGTGATFPDYDFQGPIHAVSQVVSTDGAGGVYSMNYRYGGARIHRRGRGNLGMGSQTVTDSRNGISATSRFSQVFPWIGLTISQTTRQPDGRKLTELTSELAQKIFGAGFSSRHFPFVASTQAQEYELNGVLIKSATVTSAYDNLGNVTEQRTGLADEPGNNFQTVVNTTYQNNLQTNCLGRWTRMTTTQILPDGRSETRAQEAVQDTVNCRIISSTDQPATPLAVTTRYEYDLWGNQNLIEMTGAGMAPRVVRREFGPTGQFPTRLINPLGHATLQRWDEALGVMRSTTDPNGLTTQWQHDGFGRPLREIRPDGSETVWLREWCSLGCGLSTGMYQITTTIGSTLTSATAGSGTVIYDRLDRGVRTLTTMLGGRQSLVDVEYDSLGRVRRTTEPYFTGDLRFYTVMAYDLLNRVVEENRPVSESQPFGRVTRAAYNGLVSSTTSPNGQTTTRYANALGQTIKVLDHLGGEMHYRYNPFGEVAAITDANGNTKTTTYDTRGNPILVVDPDLGQWRYTYNALGELTSQVNPKNQTTSFVYDALGRMTKRSEPEGVSKWEYDTGSGKGVGQIAAVIGPNNYAEYYAYDDLGRISEAITDTGESAQEIRTGTNIDDTTDFSAPIEPNLGLYIFRNYYDEFSRISKIIYPEAFSVPFSVQYNCAGVSCPSSPASDVSAVPFSVQYRYDASGALEQVSDATLPSRIFWSAGAVNARGQSVAESWGDGSSIQRTYDAARGYLSSQMAQGKNGPLQALTYEWDAENNLVARRDSRQNLAERFEYDHLNRLASTRVNNGTTYSMDYSPTGNITQRNGVGTYQYKGSQPAAVTAAGSKSFSYDLAGNMQQREQRTLDWTSYNLPSRIAGLRGEDQFRYGPARNRYWRHERLVLPLEEAAGVQNHPKVKPITDPLTNSEYFPRYVRETTYVDIRGLYEKWTRDGVDTHRYLIRVGGRVVAQHSQTGGTVQTHYFHRDHLGSLDVITDELGNVAARLSYDAWGQARNAQTWSGPPAQGAVSTVLDITRAGYTGHEMLRASGTVHMNARVYDPGTGRMLSADPTIPQMWNAQTHNRYAYVYNNPLSLWDPTGLSGEPVQLDSVKRFGSEDDRRLASMYRIEQEAAAYSAFKMGPLPPSDNTMAQRLLDLMRLTIEAAQLQQEVYNHPGSRLNKLRQQRADRAKARAQSYAYSMSAKDGVRLGVGAIEAGAGLVTTVTAGGAATICAASGACGGVALTGYTLAAIAGAISTQDGITQMDNAMTGGSRPSFLGAVGFLIDGDQGKAFGEFFGNFFGFVSGAKGAAGVAEGRFVGGIDAVTAAEDQINQ